MATQSTIKAKMPRHKSVRFALQGLDGETYRTLAELRAAETAPLEYLYALHCDGTLERWLAQQRCTEELEALHALPKEQASEAHLRTLANILYPGAELDIDALVRHWKIAELWREQRGEAEDRQQNLDHVLGFQLCGFRDLCQGLIDDAKNMTALKEHLLRLEQQHLPLLRWLIKDLVNFMWCHSPACLLLLLASRSYRSLLEEKDLCSGLIIHINSERKRLLSTRDCLENIGKNRGFWSVVAEGMKEIENNKLAQNDQNRKNAGSENIKSLFAELGTPLQSSISAKKEALLNLVDFFRPNKDSGIVTLVYEGWTDSSGKYRTVASRDQEYMLIPNDDSSFLGTPKAYGKEFSREYSPVSLKWPIIKGVEVASNKKARFYYMEAF